MEKRNTEIINQIQKLQNRRIELLKEFAIAKEREEMNAKFILRKDNSPGMERQGRYMVILITDGSLVRYGRKSEIQSYLRLRNLSNGQVFSSEIYPEVNTW